MASGFVLASGPVPFESPAIWFDEKTGSGAGSSGDGKSYFSKNHQLFFFQLPSHLPTKPLPDAPFRGMAAAQKAAAEKAAAEAAIKAGIKPEPDDKKAAAKKKAAAAAADKKVAGGAAAGGKVIGSPTAGDEQMTAAERDLAAQRARSSKLQSLFVPGACELCRRSF